MIHPMKTIRFLVNSYDDRQRIIKGLTNSGYFATVEKKEISALQHDYYVVVKGKASIHDREN